MEFQNNNIFGFDVSKYQRIPAQNGQPAKEISFQRMYQYGARFVIIKAGQGLVKDPGFDYNWKAAKEAGLSRGSYYFEDKDASPDEQAKHYWNLIKNDPGEGIHAMDFEVGSHTDLDSAYRFLNGFQQTSGLPDTRIAVYTGYPFWNAAKATSLSQRSWFRKFPLWLAWYPPNPLDYQQVLIPYPWSEVLIWQNATPPIGMEVGVQSRDIDHNLFNGDEEKFKLYFTKGVPPMPVDITYTANVKPSVTLGAVVRLTPNGADSGQRLVAGAKVQITGQPQAAGLYNWYNVVYPVTGWVADILLENIVPANPVPTTHKLEVILDGEVVFTKDF